MPADRAGDHRALRALYRSLDPDPDDHLFTVELEQCASQEHRIRRRRDPKTPAATKALWRMVRRVCERAGIRPLGPHALRHGFATRLKRQGIDLYAPQKLMGHARPDTTEGYLDELRLEELEAVLAQASPKTATPHAEERSEALTRKWTSGEFFQTLPKRSTV